MEAVDGVNPELGFMGMDEEGEKENWSELLLVEVEGLEESRKEGKRGFS